MHLYTQVGCILKPIMMDTEHDKVKDKIDKKYEHIKIILTRRIN